MAVKKYPDLQITIEDITVAIALTMLEMNTHNRKVSKRLVSVYAEAMAAGEWRLNGEPIIIDKNGVIQSGQHRLLAIVESGVTIRTVVVRNADPLSVYTLDSGRKRSIADALRLRGEVNVNQLGAALQWLWRWDNDAMDMPGQTATNSHLLQLLDQTPEIRDHILMGKKLNAKLGFSGGQMAALHYVLTLMDEEDCNFFVDKILYSVGLEESDPARRLIIWAENKRSSTERPSTTTTAAVFIKAWNAFREHREVKAGGLGFRGAETFPSII